MNIAALKYLIILHYQYGPHNKLYYCYYYYEWQLANKNSKIAGDYLKIAL